MKHILIAIFTLFICHFLVGQHVNASEKMASDKKEIEQLIHQIFDGMRAGDSSMVSDCFYSDVEMYTSYNNKKGEPVLKKDDFQKFLKAVGTPHEDIWDEKIWDMEIRIDNNLAQVWAKYAFYVSGKFSHCGVDAFHLTRIKDGWRVFHLTDTRQREGCEEPKKK